jgi:hypothetical protein
MFEAFNAIAAPNLTEMSHQDATPVPRNNPNYMAGAAFEIWEQFFKLRKSQSLFLRA